MKKIFAQEIRVAVNGGLVSRCAEEDIFIDNVSTDSRTVKKGDAFFALIGENHDAHDHITEVCEAGCELLVVSSDNNIPEGYQGTYIMVEDTLSALQDFAQYYRELIDPVVIAVTGSVGKTTLKDMLAQIASEKYNTVATSKNYNNHIGVPKTIFEMAENTEILIVEMGMSAKGEIERLTCIAKPDIALISNIGISHRENFNSDDGILNAKMEITTYFESGNTLVINGDCPELVASAKEGSKNKGYKLIIVSSDSCENDGTDYMIRNVKNCKEGQITFEIENEFDTERFVLPIPGLYAGMSAGLAVAAVSTLGITMCEASSALKALKNTPHRLQPIRKDEILVIDDTYNASPDSAKSGLDYLAVAEGNRKIAVLADMNELGDNSFEMHKQVGEYAINSMIDILVIYGEKAKGIAAGAADTDGTKNTEIYTFDEKEELIRFLKSILVSGDVFYVKGSRTMKMEEVVSALLA